MSRVQPDHEKEQMKAGEMAQLVKCLPSLPASPTKPGPAQVTLKGYPQRPGFQDY